MGKRNVKYFRILAYLGIFEISFYAKNVKNFGFYIKVGRLRNKEQINKSSYAFSFMDSKPRPVTPRVGVSLMKALGSMSLTIR